MHNRQLSQAESRYYVVTRFPTYSHTNMPTYEVEVDTLLFDMDGVCIQVSRTNPQTLVSSTAALSAVWVEFAKQYNMDLDDLLENSHGKRTVENLQERLPQLSPEQALSEAYRFEDRIIEISDENRSKAKSEPTAANPQGSIVGLPGVKELLKQINDGAAAQESRRPGWAIVTSATGDYARKAFLSTKTSELPKVFVSSDDVNKGKPNPEPYKKGAELSGVDITKCIVVEDAPAGVLSGKRAGARVLGLKTTHDAKRLWLQGADFVVDDLSKVQARWEGDKVILTIDSDERPSFE